MKEFQVVAMDSAVAREFRDSKSDHFGNRAIVRTADYPNAYPCRHCLHDADQGTDLLLLAYRPFAGQGPFCEVGPIFVCEDDCTRFEAVDKLPPVVTRREVALRVYDADDMMLYAQSGLVRGGDVDKKVRKILKDPEVAKIHIRTAQYGCFLCEVVRA